MLLPFHIAFKGRLEDNQDNLVFEKINIRGLSVLMPYSTGDHLKELTSKNCTATGLPVFPHCFQKFVVPLRPLPVIIKDIFTRVYIYYNNVGTEIFETFTIS
jgi:hypothetical protein